MQIIPSHHAIETMNARDITWAEVLETVEQPETVYATKGKPTERVHQRGNVAVVTVQKPDMADPKVEILLVKTVLLRERKQWSNEDARNRNKNRPPLGLRRSGN